MTDLYAALEIPADADPDEIKRAYRARAQRAHPDKGGDEKAFQIVQRAYDVLSDPERRKRYDESGDDGQAKDEPAQVLQAVLQLMLKLIDSVDVNYEDIVAKMREHVHGAKAQLMQQRTQQELSIERRENAMRRLVRKDGGNNVLASMLEAEIAKMKRSVNALEAEVAKFDGLFALIDGYEYRAEKRPAMTTDVRTQYGNLNGLGDLRGIFGGRSWT